MKIELTQKIDGGIGKYLYTINVSDCGQVTTNYWLGNSPTDVMLQFFKQVNWTEEFVMDEFCNVGWVFNEEWDEDEYEGNGMERIEVDEIGEVV